MCEVWRMQKSQNRVCDGVTDLPETGWINPLILYQLWHRMKLFLQSLMHVLTCLKHRLSGVIIAMKVIPHLSINQF